MTSIVGMMVEFKAKTGELDAAFKKSEQGMAKLDEQTKTTTTSLDKIAGSASKFLGIIGGVGTIVGFFSAVSESTVRFSKAMGELSAITGAVGKDLEFLKNSAQNFGQTTLSSATDAATAMKLIASAKPELLSNVEALEKVTKQVITLSEASGVNMPSAVSAAVDSLNMFGKGADQAARFVDVLAAGAKYGSSEVEQTAVAIQKAGVVASQSGLSFEELNAAIQVLAENGQKAEIAGTGLRGVLLKLTTQANSNFNPAIVGMQKAFENLSKAGLTATKQKEMFGEEGITIASIMIKETARLADLTEKVKENGVAMEQASINANTYAAKITKFGNSWENAKIAIGEAGGASGGLIGVLTKDLDSLTQSVKNYGLEVGLLKGLVVDPLLDRTQRIGSAIGKAILPDSGDAGATKTTPLPYKVSQTLTDSEAMLKSGVNPAIAREQGLEKLKNDYIKAATSIFDDKTVKESFIAPIVSAGAQLTIFSETAQKAASRLENAFSSGFGDPAKRAANEVIGNLGTKEKEKFDAVAQGIDPQFFEQTQKAAAMVSQLQFANGNERKRIQKELEMLQEQLTFDAFKAGGSVGQKGVNTKMGGTFSVIGSGGGSQEEDRIKQAIVGDLNKFIAQTLQAEQRVKVSIEIKPEWAKLIKVEAETTLTEMVKKAAQQGAK